MCANEVQKETERRRTVGWKWNRGNDQVNMSPSGTILFLIKICSLSFKPICVVRDNMLHISVSRQVYYPWVGRCYIPSNHKIGISRVVFLSFNHTWIQSVTILGVWYSYERNKSAERLRNPENPFTVYNERLKSVQECHVCGCNCSKRSATRLANNPLLGIRQRKGVRFQS